ncbi:hypothetical protein L596_004448 [Steinernema carpocapsae]|uniref:G-protein coupled receptors family 1 profile domain-containing protein n=1 Tax=Steinernema carpocapsae TaxID=34508 RepID=A0A4U8UVY3_STECR|nr:hypothetical protein L596_004448 [Steinernema carpocapsae]
MLDNNDFLAENPYYHGYDIVYFTPKWNVIRYITVILYCITVIAGLVGNAWVVWKVGLVLIYNRSVKVSQKILVCILVLCLFDLTIIGTLVLVLDDMVHGAWRFGLITCKAFYSMEALNKFVPPIILVNISWFSYRSITRLPGQQKSGRVAFIVVSCIVVGTITVGIFLAIVYVSARTSTFVLKVDHDSKDVYVTTKCNIYLPPKYGIVFSAAASLIGYIITTIIYVYFYASVPVFLRKRYKALSHIKGLNVNSDAALFRVSRTVIALIIIYLVCWTPYWVMFWMAQLLPNLPRVLVIVSFFAHLLSYISCAAYPIMLTAINRGIMSAHSQIVTRKKRQLQTIKAGALQTLATQINVFEMWIRAADSAASNASTAWNGRSASTQFEEIVFDQESDQQL